MSAWCDARGGWWAAPWNPSICVRCGEPQSAHCSKWNKEKWLYRDVWFGSTIGASNAATVIQLGKRGYEGALCRECDGLMVEHPGYYAAREREERERRERVQRVQRAEAARGGLSPVQGGEVSEVCRGYEGALTLSEIPLSRAQKTAHDSLALRARQAGLFAALVWCAAWVFAGVLIYLIRF